MYQSTIPSEGALHAGAIAHVTQFPEIHHIDDIRPHITPGKGIHFFENDPFIIGRYVATMPETFQTIHDLECRGLVFDLKTGTLLSRTFHKFFNLAERQSVNDLDFTHPARLDMKLDGSMIGAFPYKGEVVFHTRGGLSDIAADARAAASKADIELAQLAFEAGFTPIFEYTAPDNRVIITYPRPQLTLLALRHLNLGYYDDTLARQLAQETGSSIAPSLIDKVVSPDELHSLLGDLQGRNDIEGAVLCFADGHRVKIKTHEYSRRHKILANIGNEKYAYDAVLQGVVDDTSVALGGDRGKVLVEFAADLERAILKKAEWATAEAEKFSHLDAKARAGAIQGTYDGALQALVFAAANGRDPREQIQHLLKRRIGTPEKRHELKAELGLPNWRGPLEDLK
jgi:RNA ligase